MLINQQKGVSFIDEDADMNRIGVKLNIKE